MPAAVVLSDFTYTNDDIDRSKSSSYCSSSSQSTRQKKFDLIRMSDEPSTMCTSPKRSSSDIRANELNTTRVVVNPAVLRYLEQSRHMTTNESIDERTLFVFDNNNNNNNNHNHDDDDDDEDEEEDEDDDDNDDDDLLHGHPEHESMVDSSINDTSTIYRASSSESIEFDKLVRNDPLENVSTYPTDFLASARLAEWILTHQQSARFESNNVVHTH
jgi:hypothetical protein